MNSYLNSSLYENMLNSHNQYLRVFNIWVILMGFEVLGATTVFLITLSTLLLNSIIKVMALFSFSDVIIAMTLIINAIALMTSRFYTIIDEDRNKYHANNNNDNNNNNNNENNNNNRTVINKINGNSKNIRMLMKSGSYKKNEDNINNSTNSNNNNNYKNNNKFNSVRMTNSNSRSTNISPTKSIISKKNDEDEVEEDDADNNNNNDANEMDMLYNPSQQHQHDNYHQQYHQQQSILSRIYILLNAIRRLSGVIVLWNIFFTILMLFVFRS